MVEGTAVLAYSIAMPCELRRQRGDPALLALAVRPGGNGDRQARLESERAAAAPLCAGCQASPGGAVFGCVGLVPTPIPLAAEAWLLSRLPAAADTTAGAILLSAVVDHEWDGRYAARLRAVVGETFAASTPLRQREEGPDSLGLTSDQAFDILLGAAHVRRAHPLLVSLLFGVIPHDTPADELGALRTAPAGLWAWLERADLPSPATDTERGGLGALVRAVATAAALGVELLVESSGSGSAREEPGAH